MSITAHTPPPHTNTLAETRRRCGLSQVQAARLLGCRTRQKIAGYERGERLPQLPRALALAAAYGVPLDQLYPALWAQAQATIAHRRRLYARPSQPTYVPHPNATTILALSPGTRKIGLAVFEALPTGKGPRAQPARQPGPARRGGAGGTAGPRVF